MPRELNKYVLELIGSIKKDITNIPNINCIISFKDPNLNGFVEVEKNPIYLSLLKINGSLARSYAQIKIDITDKTRLSWAGTAHEIRQIISTLLETLAPDSEVINEEWYKQDPQTKGPTQKQRAHYILIKQKKDSKEQEVVEVVSLLNDLIETLVRSTYGRASDAAHRFKGRREVIRILNYFESFTTDLLNLE